MRVAYVCADPGVPVFGTKGCSIHVQEVVRALRNLGDDVLLFAARADGRPPADLESAALRRIPDSRGLDARLREQAALRANGDLMRALHAEGPFDVVYERYSLWSFAAMEFAHARRIPALLEVNAPLVDEQKEHRELFDRAGAEEATRRVFAAASALLAVSDALAEWLSRHPTVRGRIDVVPNGVRPARFQGARPSSPGPPGSFTVGFLGSLKPWHGLSVLAEAFGQLVPRGHGSRLLIVGEGPERDGLERDLARIGVAEASVFSGAVPAEDVPGWLASMDAAVAPYPADSDSYFSPLKVYEYMAAGLPIVASRSGQIARLLEDGVDALLPSPGDAGALADALDRLRLDPALRRRLGRAAREKALRDHTWEAIARRIHAIAGRGAIFGRSAAAVGAGP